MIHNIELKYEIEYLLRSIEEKQVKDQQQSTKAGQKQGPSQQPATPVGQQKPNQQLQPGIDQKRSVEQQKPVPQKGSVEQQAPVELLVGQNPIRDCLLIIRYALYTPEQFIESIKSFQALSKEKSIHAVKAQYMLNLFAGKSPLECMPMVVAKLQELEKRNSVSSSETADAHYICGLLYQYGFFFPQNYQEAKKYYEKAAEIRVNHISVVDAFAKLGLFLTRGKHYGVEEDLKRGSEFLEYAAQSSHYAMSDLADNPDIDKARVIELTERAVKSKIPLILYKAYVRYYMRRIEDYSKRVLAQYYLKSSADAGYPPAQFDYGLLLFMFPERIFTQDQGRDQNNYLIAFENFEKATLADIPKAKFMLGCCLHQGLGTEKNPIRALDYIQQAANNNLPDAHCLLIEMAARATTVDFQAKVGLTPEHFERALKAIFEQSHEFIFQSNVENPSIPSVIYFANELANHYTQGILVPKDLNIASKLIDHASKLELNTTSMYYMTIQARAALKQALFLLQQQPETEETKQFVNRLFNKFTSSKNIMQIALAKQLFDPTQLPGENDDALKALHIMYNIDSNFHYVDPTQTEVRQLKTPLSYFFWSNEFNQRVSPFLARIQDPIRYRLLLLKQAESYVYYHSDHHVRLDIRERERDAGIATFLQETDNGLFLQINTVEADQDKALGLPSDWWNNTHSAINAIRQLKVDKTRRGRKMDLIAFCYHLGIGTSKDLNLAAQHYYNAIEHLLIDDQDTAKQLSLYGSTITLALIGIWDCYKENPTNIEEEELSQLMPLFEILAEENKQSEALLILGEIYEYGLAGKTVDLKKAYEFYQTLCQSIPPGQGYDHHWVAKRRMKALASSLSGSPFVESKSATEASVSIDPLYLQAKQKLKGSPEESKLGIEWLEKGVSKRHPKSMLLLGKNLLAGQHVDQDMLRAIFLIREALSHGLLAAEYTLAKAYKMLTDTREHLKQRTHPWIISLLESAQSREKHLGARFILSILYDSDNDNKNPLRSFTLMRSLANKNHQDARFRLAKYYRLGKGTQIDFSKSIKILITLASERNAQLETVLLELASIYSEMSNPAGSEVLEIKQNKHRALLIYLFCIQNNFQRVECRNLICKKEYTTFFFDPEKCSTKSFEEAIQFCQSLCDEYEKQTEIEPKSLQPTIVRAELASAYDLLALAAQLGLGMVKNLETAVLQYESAFTLGLSDSITFDHMLFCYIKGKAIPNAEHLFKFLEKESSRGNMFATLKLAQLQYYGFHHIPSNSFMALQTYRKLLKDPKFGNRAKERETELMTIETNQERLLEVPVCTILPKHLLWLIAEYVTDKQKVLPSKQSQSPKQASR